MSMTALDIVRAAIPGADERLAEAILWERTIFPCGSVTARDLYLAAARFRRAALKGVELCVWCDRVAADVHGVCLVCRKGFEKLASRRNHDERAGAVQDG